ncbi:MAG: LuxR C-terminal-related transcriptional regulator [Bacteroidetes bacterium]|nr:LuxR C-terminal-related transcriptional regulator [Bacteroidota bacterium]MBU1116929.1 LuxR C-terminal-related transcriptional regulator [Bacteroidota bacterium]MBU1799395.1 LuxR C-terminal-related transcriptional regulator [Bacteroidota bacterium]
MIEENKNTYEALTNLNEVISSISCKSDFYEIESEFFNSISSIIPAHATALYLFKSFKQRPYYISGKGVDEDFLSFYEKRGREIDPLKNWIMTKRTPNQSQLLLGLKGWQHHPVYNIVKTASIDFAMQAPIITGNEIIGSINFGREFSEGAFKQNDLLTISIVSHFLGLAILGSFGNSSVAEYNRRFCFTIDNMKQGMIITDNDFRVNYVNRVAKGTIIRHFGSDDPEVEFSNQLKEVSIAKENCNITIANNLKLRSCSLPGSRKKQTIVFIDDNPSPTISNSVSEIFTAREIDVLLLVERGMQNKEIARELNISVNTVKRHLENMFGRFNVNSRTKLISKFYYLNNK